MRQNLEVRRMNESEKPPSKDNIKDSLGIGSTYIPADDIKGKQRVGWWDKLKQPILYPAGSSVCTRCSIVFDDIQRG